ncbi:MAG: PLD nuclease N-terminal domain-containing protein [Promethearchaeota archaeon]
MGVMTISHEEGQDWMAGDWMMHDSGLLWPNIYWMFIGMGLLVLVTVLVAVYVHADAQRREVPNPGVWVLIVLLFNIVGLVVYLLVRRSYLPGIRDDATLEAAPQP